MGKPTDTYARDGETVINAMMWLEMAAFGNPRLKRLKITTKDAIWIAHTILQGDLGDPESKVRYDEAMVLHNKVRHDSMLDGLMSYKFKQDDGVVKLPSSQYSGPPELLLIQS